jgi:outer membrane protein assembly factor BamD
MNRRLTHIVALFALLLGTAGCSGYQKLLQSNDIEKKYQAAIKYYEKEDYYRAGELLDQVAPLLRGSDKAETAYFYQAKSHYEQRNYILSETYFRNFYTTYPRSALAEQAMFLAVKSSYNQSPGYEQDQAPTLTALEGIDEFLIRYPESEYVDEANQMMEELNIKLDKKAFINAQLYHQIRYFKSAVVALENFLQERPGSPFSEEVTFLKLDSQFNYAAESVLNKQEERYFQVVDFYQNFVDLYPDSKYMRSAEQIYSKAVAELERIKSQKTNQENS